MLEVKVNKEIRDYTESMFFGLSMRQFVFSFLACSAAVGSYFLFRPVLGTEITSWICVLVATPFAAIGFVKYNGMPAEKFFAAFVKSQFRIPRVLVMRNGCYFMKDPEEKGKRRPIPNSKVILPKHKAKAKKNKKHNKKRNKKKRMKGEKVND